MPEMEQPVDVVHVEYGCDDCPRGVRDVMVMMKFTGYTTGSSSLSLDPSPRLYQHRCSEGHMKMLTKQYPLLEPRERP